MSPTSIDMPTYETLKSDMGEDFMVELVETYLADAPSLLSEIRQSLAKADCESFRRAAHSLKSTSASLGALQLSSLAKELEMLGKSGSLDNASEKIELAAREFGQVESTLRELIHVQ